MSGRHFFKQIAFNFLVFSSIGLFGFTQLVAAAEPINKRFTPAPKTAAPRIAIIIDDIGYSFERGKQATRLPGAVTLSIIPHSPHSISLAKAGHERGKEIMLHAPMSNLLNKPLDEGALSYGMGYFSFRETLKNNLQSIPYVKGINNHMGSLLTQQKAPMRWLMEELQTQKLFFIDSRTTSNSIALEIAQEENIPSAERDIFLDNDRDHLSIARQFEKFISRAQSRGTAIAIGHPYPETLDFLEQTLPKLNNLNIHLVPVSSLLSSFRAEQKTTRNHLKPSTDSAFDYFSTFSMQTKK